MKKLTAALALAALLAACGQATTATDEPADASYEAVAPAEAPTEAAAPADGAAAPGYSPPQDVEGYSPPQDAESTAP